MNKWRALCSRLQTGPLNYSLTCKRRRHENSFCTYSIILVEGKINVKHEIRKKWANILCVDIHFDMDYTLFYRNYYWRDIQ